MERLDEKLNQVKRDLGMNILHRVWLDDAGVIVSAELVLYLTILVVGLIVGMSAVRTSIVQELGDIATAFGVLNQSYSYGGVWHCFCACTPGSAFLDRADVCDAYVFAPFPHANAVNVNKVAMPELP